MGDSAFHGVAAGGDGPHALTNHPLRHSESLDRRLAEPPSARPGQGRISS
ncbi:hypothetical protein HMPREF1549_02540 [Actinomyces johnsonii F0510]|uniref:Uncharacterized protein n=1 Tax=Actinomyces johnsonii F0510 TaxID=1227262 RepID=U1PID8_9ACTO|nr:hypothetical protein HMPREF1549_02540 [Actinomyces johnsonii F0510]